MIAEKPRAAEKIAYALCDSGSPICKRVWGVKVWFTRYFGKNIVVVSAAGHLFGLNTWESGYPVFSYRWRPLWEIDSGAKHTQKFYRVIQEFAKGAYLVVNACDYDVEGSVIGYMIIRHFGDTSRAYRMKFSSLTPTSPFTTSTQKNSFSN